MTDERLEELERLATLAAGDYYPDSGSAVHHRQAVETLAESGPVIVAELVAEVCRLRGLYLDLLAVADRHVPIRELPEAADGARDWKAATAPS